MHQVSEGALLRRINRRLYRDDFQAVRRCREDSRAYTTLGRFYVLDFALNIVVATDVDLEGLARELRVMSDAEQAGPTC